MPTVGVSTLGQALAQADRIKVQQNALSSLSTQLTTGKKTQKFTGLGTDVLTSQRSREVYGHLDRYISNIKNADRRIKMMQDAIQQFKDQARNFLDVLRGLSQESVHQKGDVLTYDDPATSAIETTQVGMTSAEPDVDFQSMIDYASKIYDTFMFLMNIQDGDRYLLSGAETRSQPITDTGTLDAAMSTLITEWKGGTITTSELILDLQNRTTETNPNALTDSTVGYSLELSNGNVSNIFVRVDDHLEIDYTALASEVAFRDILVAAFYVKNENLPPIADVYTDPATAIPPFTPDVRGAPGADLDEQKNNFFQVINALAKSVSEAVDDLDLIGFKLSTAEARITDIKNSHQQEQAFLADIISDVEDADQNEVALKINTLLTQLEASYAVTSRVQSLSLVNFI